MNSRYLRTDSQNEGRQAYFAFSVSTQASCTTIRHATHLTRFPEAGQSKPKIRRYEASPEVDVGIQMCEKLEASVPQSAPMPLQPVAILPRSSPSSLLVVARVGSLALPKIKGIHYLNLPGFEKIDIHLQRLVY